MARRRPAPQTTERAPRSWAPVWHAAWLAAVVAAGAGLAYVAPGDAAWTAGVLAAGGAPALAGLTLGWFDRPRVRDILLMVWTLGAGSAVILTGGVSGPLAPWCLAPALAAAVLGGRNRLALGAALALGVTSAAALADRFGFAPAPPATGPADMWLSFLSLATVAVGLGAGLILHDRRAESLQVGGASGARALRALLEDLPQLTVSIDAEGRPAALFGAAPRGVDRGLIEQYGLAAVAVSTDRAKVQDAVRRAFLDGGAQVDFAPAGAADRSCELILRRSQPGAVTAMVRDVTGERQREAILVKEREDAEALAAGRSRFLANMSHELRTPLNAIMGFSDIMRARMFGTLPDKYAEYGELIHESGAHLLDLINDILDMSKIEADRYELAVEVFDAREAVSGALRLMRVQADSAGVKLRGMLPAVVLQVEADRRAIKQIVLNLLSNALKFTPKGGAVTVATAIDHNMFELVVQDTGVGISAEDLERLGRPYEQAGDFGQRSKGTGLGLSLVRALAKLHGGEMTLKSTLGEGTVVMVRLPIAIGAQPLAPPQVGGNVVAFSPGR